MVGVFDRHGKTDGPPPQRIVDVGLDHTLIALWSVNSPLQLLFPVVAPFGTEVIQARLCTNSDRSGIAEVALFDHLQDVGAVKRRLLADGLAIQAIRGGRDFQDEGPFEGLQDSLILRCTAPMSFIYHDQAIVHSWEQCQVIGAANGINTGHCHLPTIVVDAPSYLPDDGRRFHLAVFLGRLREQLVCVGDNERVYPVTISKLSNHLAEDDGFAGGRGEDQQRRRKKNRRFVTPRRRHGGARFVSPGHRPRQWRAGVVCREMRYSLRERSLPTFYRTVLWNRQR